MGLKRVTCSSCNGQGQVVRNKKIVTCKGCNGSGIKWEDDGK